MVATAIGIPDLSLCVCLFRIGDSCGKKLLVIDNYKYRIRDLVLKTTGLPIGNIISVYKNFDSTARVILFGYPHSKSIYITIEEMRSDFKLSHRYMSPVFYSKKQIEFFLESLTDITKTCCP